MCPAKISHGTRAKISHGTRAKISHGTRAREHCEHYKTAHHDDSFARVPGLIFAGHMTRMCEYVSAQLFKVWGGYH